MKELEAPLQSIQSTGNNADTAVTDTEAGQLKQAGSLESVI